MTSTQRNEILLAYRAGLVEELGEALDAVILYGSHARGEERDDSDIDLLCVMRRPFDYGEMIARTSALTAQLSLEHGVVFSRAFVTREDYESRQLPFLMNVRKEGVAV
ncbi:MAG: nucleotidyltransferase domain-containing protein [Candidatus Hydrogenedentes bacterium]|nr:nucleotidyltransferase domain-containing protein [Candidatus Hydrogenedentota bacterium]